MKHLRIERFNSINAKQYTSGTEYAEISEKYSLLTYFANFTEWQNLGYDFII